MAVNFTPDVSRRHFKVLYARHPLVRLNSAAACRRSAGVLKSSRAEPSSTRDLSQLSKGCDLMLILVRAKRIFLHRATNGIRECHVKADRSIAEPKRPTIQTGEPQKSLFLIL